MQAIFEGRNDAEIAAATTDRPEQVRILRQALVVTTRPSASTISAAIILSQASPCFRSVPHSATERKAGDPGVAVHAHSGWPDPMHCVAVSNSPSVTPGSARAVAPRSRDPPGWPSCRRRSMTIRRHRPGGTGDAVPTPPTATVQQGPAARPPRLDHVLSAGAE